MTDTTEKMVRMEHALRDELSSYLAYDPKGILEHAQEEVLSFFMGKYGRGSSVFYEQALDAVRQASDADFVVPEGGVSAVSLILHANFPTGVGDETTEHLLVEIPACIERAASVLYNCRSQEDEVKARAVCKMMFRFPDEEPDTYLAFLNAFKAQILAHQQLSSTSSYPHSFLPENKIGARLKGIFKNMPITAYTQIIQDLGNLVDVTISNHLDAQGQGV